ncbi:MAG: MscS mechanosensitive ion channel [Candidatus Magnetoglobus multicellularis str. Araruama]|uniref:MscS mechanosensitive ion channel n=1 Tax=Candidatus Magnetoglobus multicellularis str. Araruama TaxID=890399 RepID=A0A1V1PB56_9BACT|nr:MAG: MscS mechanosensitive ion channel [Candidatus Magnetoglobus multicellularis str. Araruama]
MADGTIVLVDDQYMFQTNIIYTGIHINTIQDINLSDQIHVLDFYIWFKYRGDINASDIIFLNAVKPLGLGKPIETEYSNGEHYEMYHVKGQFMCNAIDMSVDAGNNILGFSFRHATKPEYNIVYVSDISVMNANNNDRLLQDINQSSPAISTKYSARKLYYFSDVTYKKAFGKPGYLSESINGGVEFSRYNFFVHINEKKVSFRRITWNFYINLLMTIMSIMSLFLTASVLKSFAVKYPRLTWGVQLFMGYVLLISSEPLLLVFQVDESRLSYFEFIKLAYDIFWWLVPASFINLAIKRFIWIPLENKTGRRIPKIVTNSVIFLIYLMTFFGIVAYVFDQKLTSLLATSGVLAMIIGLAIQVNIANVFSGIVINIEQPFRIGDWIEIDHKFKGKVVDITWRTTRILTHSGNILSFPNSYTSESPINNYCYPDRNVWIKIIIHINPTYSPEKIKKICMDAMLSIDGLVKEIRPIIRYQLTDWCADYTLLFCINDYSKKIQFKSELYERIWIHLNRIGIEPAIKRQEVHMFRGTKDRGEEALNPLSILSEIDIFKGFSDELRKQLSQKMHQHQYHTEEYIIKQGNEGDSLFIIIEGSVSVQILIDGKHVEVDRMGAGTFFGEMALLTGEPRNASIVAITNCVLYEITKCDIAPLFTYYPEITDILSKELTRRAVNRQQKKEHYDQERIDKDALKNSFFSKISNCFGINKNVREIDRECVDTDFSI